MSHILTKKVTCTINCTQFTRCVNNAGRTKKLQTLTPHTLLGTANCNIFLDDDQPYFRELCAEKYCNISIVTV